MLFLVSLLRLGSFTAWAVRQRQRLRRGERVQYFEKRTPAKKPFLWQVALWLVFLFFMILALIQRDWFSLKAISIFAGFFAVLAALGYGITKTKHVKWLSSLFSGLLVSLILAVAFAVALSPFYLIASIFSAKLAVPEIPTTSKTFLASTEEITFTADEDGEARNYHYTVFKSKFDFILNWYIHDKTHRYFSKDYRALTAPEWGAQEVFAAGLDTYVVYGDHIISYNFLTPLTKEIADSTLP